MKGSKYSKLMRPWNLKGFLRNRRNPLGALMKVDYNLSTFMMLACASGLIVMLCRITCHGSSRISSQTTPGWDRHRKIWMDQHPILRHLVEERPRIMMVTGSSPQLCDSPVASHIILQSAKNKLDYCRLHDIGLYYSSGNPNPHPHPKFSADWWVTLPILRMLMLQHPEVEWFWWVDADAVFTDLSLEPRYADLKDHNLVLFREDRRDKTGIHTGNYLIRNCQWSLDLIQAWGTTSAKTPDYNISTTWTDEDSAVEGKSESSFDARKLAVVTSLLDPRQNAGDKVKETEHWVAVAPNLEELQVKDQQKQDLGGLPLVTHFPGCMPCSTASSDDDQLSSAIQQQQQLEQEQEQDREDVCLIQLDRTFDFADNQVYDQYGFKGRALGSSKTDALRKLATEDSIGTDSAHGTSDEEEFSMLPRITTWDEQRRARVEKTPRDSPNKVMLVSGSAPKACHSALGGSMLVRGLKNKMDYCRLHGVEFFYNMATVDKDLTGWWSKLPLLRMLMLKNPDIEWLWWMDSDAVITDMNFEIPFESKYDVNGGYNLVMYGEEGLMYDEKNFRAINTGNFFLRNCQWSIDLLDKWASFATSVEVMKQKGVILSEFLKNRPTNWFADDQSVLVYILITERERWSSKVILENSEVEMSGDYLHWTPRFLDNVVLSYKPFVTHFAGCTPCGSTVTDKCLSEMDRTFNFADNQVLEPSGFCHEHLRSPKIVSSCSMGSVVI